MGQGGYAAISFDYRPEPQGCWSSEIRYYKDKEHKTPSSCRAGHLAIKREYRKDGTLARDVFMGVGEEAGCDRLVREYDGEGRIISQRYEDSPGVAIEGHMGYAWATWRYNGPESESPFAVTYLDRKGNEVRTGVFVTQPSFPAKPPGNLDLLLQSGDVITAYGDLPVANSADLLNAFLGESLQRFEKHGEIRIANGDASVQIAFKTDGQTRQGTIPKGCYRFASKIEWLSDRESARPLSSCWIARTTGTRHRVMCARRRFAK